MGLREMAQAVGGELHGADTRFSGVSTDTRTLQAGQLFVALNGPKHDGHAFVGRAQEKHAAGALVAHLVSTDLPYVTVEDTRLALGVVGGYWRAKFDCPVIAVTGSNGKTTVKEMIGSILSRQGPVLVSPGNLNNDVGLPLVLCRLRREHAFAVVEMGMNHLGEIDYLTRLARPHVAVITNVAPAHLEGLGSLDAIARAKAEIFNGLDRDGVAVVNADDPYARSWLHRAQDFRRITFGMDRSADVTVSELHADNGGSMMRLRVPAGACEVMLALPGLHNVMNALAAAAAALAVGADLEQIRLGLNSVVPVAGRLTRRPGVNGVAVIDDTYNANPASMAAAIRVLAAETGEKILVIGDMRELGDTAPALHAGVGEHARREGIDRLLTVGELSQAAADAFGAGAAHFDDKAALIEALLPDLGPRTTVLVKGSRGMHMEEVVRAITNDGRSH